ncbi:conserved hypothetical protein [Roseibium sp. TrichSKD4]|uniref:hypothetical protein n=1 Tax=Roseibium sp. TrichSKD4 TaxID=744980 RepID=UPI0001E562B7|nr:hypothetical protein [Roseibium sp. TrichSKD4]EFO33843.1 conserved hypothetical protein [Roseibium sp. TrichSKD4]
MHQNMKATGLALAAALFMTVPAAAYQTSQETIALPHDDLSVTVAAAPDTGKGPLDEDMSIWVGEIELNGRNVLWVELIDAYGEVIYDAEVRSNETHLLPDGRAIVVRSNISKTSIVKLQTDRVPADQAAFISRQVVQVADTGTSVEFVETPSEAEDGSLLLEAARFGESLWASFIGFFSSAADRVQVAWNWMFEPTQA